MNGKVIKVLQISSYPPPLSGWGMRVYVLKREMEKQGHTCTVLNVGKGRFIKGRDFVPVLGGLDYVKKVLRFRLKGFLVHMHLNGDSPKGFVLTCLALTISILTFRRPVITFHAGPVQKYFPQSEAPQLTLMFKYIFGVAKNIICNSNAEKKAIAGYGVAEKKIVPIQAFTRQYLEFDRIALAEEIEAFYKKFDQAFCTYIFYRPQYFLEEMMEGLGIVFKQRPNAAMVMMGPDRDQEAIIELMRKNGIEDRVLIIGNQPHDAFLTVMAKSKLYLRTHWKDGVSSSVLESLAMGIPVVACENGRRPESTVTFENQNVQDMVEKVLYVLDNHEQAVKSIIKPEIPDTIVDEMAVLTA